LKKPKSYIASFSIDESVRVLLLHKSESISDCREKDLRGVHTLDLHPIEDEQNAEDIKNGNTGVLFIDVID
jgi:hypothetical protein